MKKLSETLTELGVAFTFPIDIKDANGSKTYYENSNGCWHKWEYDANGKVNYFGDSEGFWYKYERDDKGKVTYFENSDGTKQGTPRSAKTCEGKVIEVDGIKYKLTTL